MQILNYRDGPQFDNDKSVATFDVIYNGSTYIDLRLMIGKQGGHYISYPCKKRTDPFGKPEFVRYYKWTDERTKEFDKLVLEALKAFQSGR